MSGGRFEGQWLSEYLEDYHKINRKSGESDWDLRKRAFVEVYPQDPVAAIEFLYGCHKDELSQLEEVMVGVLMITPPTPESLQRFADKFNGDPMLSRIKKAHR